MPEENSWAKIIADSDSQMKNTLFNITARLYVSPIANRTHGKNSGL